MNNVSYIWGTYRHVADYAEIIQILSGGSLLGIDTAPNYQGGRAEAAIGSMQLSADIRIFGKVGYTSGDGSALRSLTGGARHCLSPDYIRARVSTSADVVFPRGGQFESVLLHNPEHLWEGVEEREGDARAHEAFSALGALVSGGVTKTIGVATWTLSPYSPRGRKLFDLASGVMDVFGYFMHPVSILRRDLLDHLDSPLNPQMRMIASAPLAGAEAMRLLGPLFARYFQGVEDPLAQSLMLAQTRGLWPCIGIGTPAHAAALVQLGELPSMRDSDLIDLLALLGPQ